MPLYPFVISVLCCDVVSLTLAYEDETSVMTSTCDCGTQAGNLDAFLYQVCCTLCAPLPHSCLQVYYDAKGNKLWGQRAYIKYKQEKGEPLTRGGGSSASKRKASTASGSGTGRKRKSSGGGGGTKRSRK